MTFFVFSHVCRFFAFTSLRIPFPHPISASHCEHISTCNSVPVTMAAYTQISRLRLEQNEDLSSAIADMPVSPGMNIDAIIEMYTYSDQRSRMTPSTISPRHVSSVYSLNEDYVQTSHTQFPIKQEVCSSLDMQGHTRKKSNTSRFLRRMPTRPLTKDQSLHLISAETRSPEQKFGLYREPEEVHTGRLVSWGMPEPRLREDEFISSLPQGGLTPRPLTIIQAWKSEDHHTIEQKLDATRWATEYQSSFHPVSPLSPDLSIYHAISTNAPYAISPRITNVCDEIIVPEVFRDDIANEATPPSPLSNKSFRVDSLRILSRESFRPIERIHGKMEEDTPRMTSDLHDSIHGARGASSTPSNTQSGNDEARPRICRPRERSPAIPLTDYQKHGTKAWERPKGTKSSKRTSQVLMPSDLNISTKSGAKTASPQLVTEASTRSSDVSPLPASARLSSKEKQRMVSYSMDTYTDMRPKKNRSVSQKLATAFQSGTEHVVRLDRQKPRRTKDEDRRVELKKRIKVLVHSESKTEGFFF